MATSETYTIGKLAEEAEVTTRTIRYYVAEGVLPPPNKRGRVALYKREHLERLALIKILKDEYLPLQEIGSLLAGLDAQAVTELLKEKQGADQVAPAPDSAKIYLRSLLNPAPEQHEGPQMMRSRLKAKKQTETPPPAKGGQMDKATEMDKSIPQDTPELEESLLSPPSSAPNDDADALEVALADLEPESDQPERGLSHEGRQAEPPPSKSSISSSTAPAAAAPPPVAPDQIALDSTTTHWRRIQITPDIELHIRDGDEIEKTNLWQKIDRLIKVSRRLLNS